MMLIVEIPEHGSQAKILLDGVDVTRALAVMKIEVAPVEPQKLVEVTLTIQPNLLKISALPEWIKTKLAS